MTQRRTGSGVTGATTMSGWSGTILSRQARQDFGAALKESRLARGYSQGELAAACGLHQSTISLYEAGNVAPALMHVEELSHCLAVEPNYLLKSLPGLEEKN